MADMIIKFIQSTPSNNTGELKKRLGVVVYGPQEAHEIP